MGTRELSRFLPKSAEIAQRIAADNEFNPVKRDLLEAGFKLWLRSGGVAPDITGICSYAGYSRATFYRNFKSREIYLLRIYQTAINILIFYYEQTLKINFFADCESFCRYTVAYFYRPAALLSNDSICRLFNEHTSGQYYLFHRHLNRIALGIQNHLVESKIPDCRHVGFDEIYRAIQVIDWEILSARGVRASQFPSMLHYRQLIQMLWGILVTR